MSNVEAHKVPKRRVCFDIETEPFSDAFLRATSPQARLREAPRMRIACAYVEHEKRYRFFVSKQSDQLLELLQGADEVVSFNGKAFDLLVLRKHYGLKGKVPMKGRHVDIHMILTARAGFRVSLHVAAQMNLGEGKHTKGREMTNLDPAALRIACKSDVRQTYRLWKPHEDGTLQAPYKKRRTERDGGEWLGGPGSFMPDLCPNCHDVGSLRFLDWDDDDDLTDGQQAEYLAGTQGSAVCESCKHVFNWNV